MKNLELGEYLKDIYVRMPKSKDEERLTEIKEVIEDTGLDRAKLHFICRDKDMIKFLEKNYFNVIEVNSVLITSDFQKMKL